jgi:hypothetical protein
VTRWFFAGLTATLVAFAQPLAASCAGSGTIQGVLTDFTTGAPLGGIKVSASGPSFRAETVTDAHGLFTFFGVYAASVYRLNAEGPGVHYVRNGVPAFGGQMTNLGTISILRGWTGVYVGAGFAPAVPVFNLGETIDSYSVTTSPPYTGKPGL